MRRKITPLLVVFLVAVMLMQAGCITSPVAVTSANTPVHDKKIIMNYGPVQGYHRVWSVFGLWMVGKPDIDLAIQDALKKKGGDALINISCYQKTSWFFFVSETRVIVEGEAVSFDNGGAEKDKGKQTNKVKK